MLWCGFLRCASVCRIFLFGISGVAVFILAIFIIGCAISVFSQLNEAVVHLAYFSFLLIYPAFVMSAMFFINKSMDASGNLLDIHTVGLALVFLVASCTDMFAYFFGSLFGRHKLVPSISPKKTWEGAAGGLFGGLVGAGIVYLLFETSFALFSPGLPLSGGLKIVVYVIIGIFGSASTQIGDLVASLVKRQCGIKDYSNLLGAHGGIMDRFDGMMFNAAFIAIIYAFLLS